MTQTTRQSAGLTDRDIARLCLDRGDVQARRRGWAVLEARHKPAIVRHITPLLGNRADAEAVWQDFVVDELSTQGGARLASFLRGALCGSRQSLRGYLGTCLKHAALAQCRRAARERDVAVALQRQSECEAGARAADLALPPVPAAWLDVLGAADAAFADGALAPAAALRALSDLRRQCLRRALNDGGAACADIDLLIFFERVDDLVGRAADAPPCEAPRSLAARRFRRGLQQALLRGLDPDLGPSGRSLSGWSEAQRTAPLRPGWGVTLGATWAALWACLVQRGFARVGVEAVVRASFVARALCRHGALSPCGRLREPDRVGALCERIVLFRRDGAALPPFAQRRVAALRKARARAQRRVCAAARAQRDPALTAAIRLLFHYWQKGKRGYFERHLPMPR